MAHIQGISHLLLQVEDLARAEGFYVGVLGMAVKERGALKDGRPLLVLREGLGLTVFPPGSAPGARTFDHLAFRVADLDGLHGVLQAAGVKILDGPVKTSYGRALYVLDPEGNKIGLFRRICG